MRACQYRKPKRNVKIMLTKNKKGSYITTFLFTNDICL